MHLRADRLEYFKNLLWDKDLTSQGPFVWDGIPGITGMAALGLSTIFTDIPSKFPVMDLLRFLQQQGEVESVVEVERRLELMGQRIHALDCEGNET